MFDNMIKKMMKKNAGMDEDMKVTVEVDGEVTKFTNNVIVMHMGEEHGTIMGAVSPIGLVRAVGMLMDSINNIMEDMSPMDQMMLMLMMEKAMEERVKSE